VSALVDEIPEPVADEYFAAPAPSVAYLRPTVGALARGSRTASMCELTHARIHRFRDDVDWKLFDAPPPPDSMAALSLWVDPALDDEDLDGLVCEAIAIGLPVVASRTATNRRRSDDGRAAALCPKNDPNELAHAIVSLLFKDERSASLRAAACEIREKFRPARRREALLETYARVAR
jgi:glycosyltransferase involved in cell wall biosynthesis